VEQSIPPQSTSDSSPFLTLSVQEEQMPLSQRPPSQSEAVAHFLPSAHLAQSPPQSTSDSLWFNILSAQLAAAHLPPTQNWAAQSADIRQVFPAAQAGQLPPQSTSVSLPFSVRSVQLKPASGVGPPLSLPPPQPIKLAIRMKNAIEKTVKRFIQVPPNGGPKRRTNSAPSF
jgi:hypothetical protein